MNRFIISQTIIANINIVDYNWGTFPECRCHHLIQNNRTLKFKTVPLEHKFEFSNILPSNLKYETHSISFR